MNTPNLDDMLDHLQESESGFSTKEQRAELIALKQRCDQLERFVLLARSALERMECSLTDWDGMVENDREMEKEYKALSPEAREALRKR